MTKQSSSVQANSCAVQITDRARKELVKKISEKKKACGIRLFIRDGKGCSGAEYAMEYVFETPSGHDALNLADSESNTQKREYDSEGGEGSSQSTKIEGKNEPEATNSQTNSQLLKKGRRDSSGREESVKGVLYIPLEDTLRFFGMVIDFGADNLGNSRFLFNNPNETGKCGCGESVSFDARFSSSPPS